MSIRAKISDLASRSDGSSVTIVLRLSSMALSIALFIVTIVNVSISGGWWYFIPSTVYFAWQTSILVLAHRGTKIPSPIAIFLDLLLLLSALIFIFLSIIIPDGYYYPCNDGSDYTTPCKNYLVAFGLFIACCVITGFIS